MRGLRMSQFKTYLMLVGLTATLVPGAVQAGGAELDPQAIALRDAILACDTAEIQDLLAAGTQVGFSTRYGGINHIALAQEACQDAIALLKPVFLQQGEQARRRLITGRD